MKQNRLFIASAFFAVSLISPVLALSQSEGINFENNPSWSAILAKAQKEKKYIFMDCYTTWCAPCRTMSQNIFPQKIVGDVFNANFISISVQIDRTLGDDENTRAKYELADSINTKYQITAYPTYLIFSPEGVAIDRFIGSLEATDLIARAKASLDPEKRYYTIVRDCKVHSDDSTFLRNALSIALESHDKPSAGYIAEYYFAVLKAPFSTDNIHLLTGSIHSSSSRVFSFFLLHSQQIDQILQSTGYVEDLLCYQICSQELAPLFKDSDAYVNCKQVINDLTKRYPSLTDKLQTMANAHCEHLIKGAIMKVLYDDGPKNPDWQLIEQKIKNHFPANDIRRLVDQIKPDYYESKMMWQECEKSALVVLEQYGDKLDAHTINNIVWYDLFLHSSNGNSLKAGLKWSRHSIDLQPQECGYLDTYANLLYKLGAHQNALVWEKKAVDLCGVSEEGITANFKKMQNGEKTWLEEATR